MPPKSTYFFPKLLTGLLFNPLTRERPAQAGGLRAVLLDPAEAGGVGPGGSAQAAVLAPLYERDGELVAVFTQRRQSCRAMPVRSPFPAAASRTATQI